MDTPTTRRTTNGPRPIHPAIRKVWLFSNVMTFGSLAIVTSLMEFGFLKAVEASWRFPIFMPVLWIGIGAWSASFVKRQWQAWRYEVTDHEVILSWGVWYQVKRFVPRDRIQHVDITSGPIARKFGLAHVHLYVAGAHGAVGGIPGLTPSEAEDLRAMLVETQAEHV
ncbi:MAG TPA: PH domain-containing protein [Fimbriimonadaceae bacterium]|nr:PH domain-containing protein [Fimbriimonadaceae bacterium]